MEECEHSVIILGEYLAAACAITFRGQKFFEESCFELVYCAMNR